MLFGHICWSWQVMLFLTADLIGFAAFAASFALNKRYGMKKIRLVSNLTLAASICTGFALLIGIANVTCGVDSLRFPGDLLAMAVTGAALLVFGIKALHYDEIRFNPAHASRESGI